MLIDYNRKHSLELVNLTAYERHAKATQRALETQLAYKDIEIGLHRASEDLYQRDIQALQAALKNAETDKFTQQQNMAEELANLRQKVAVLEVEKELSQKAQMHSPSDRHLIEQLQVLETKYLMALEAHKVSEDERINTVLRLNEELHLEKERLASLSKEREWLQNASISTIVPEPQPPPASPHAIPV